MAEKGGEKSGDRPLPVRHEPPPVRGHAERQTTKMHALTDTIGRPYSFDLTPGNVSDMEAADRLLRRADGARYIIAD